MEIIRRVTIQLGENVSYRVYLRDESGRRVSLDTFSELSDAVAVERGVEILSSMDADALSQEAGWKPAPQFPDDGTYKIKLVSWAGNEIEIDGRVTIEDLLGTGEIVIPDEFSVFVGNAPKKIIQVIKGTR